MAFKQRVIMWSHSTCGQWCLLLQLLYFVPYFWASLALVERQTALIANRWRLLSIEEHFKEGTFVWEIRGRGEKVFYYHVKYLEQNIYNIY